MYFNETFILMIYNKFTISSIDSKSKYQYRYKSNFFTEIYNVMLYHKKKPYEKCRDEEITNFDC